MKYMKKMLFIFNPRSGKGQIRTKLLDIIDVFTKAGYEVITHPTQAERDASRTVVSYADQIDMVVCSGGDGTLDEVVDGLMMSRSDLPLGYIPAGSTNDFGDSVGIPHTLIDAANDIVNGRTYLCDVGLFNDSRFVYVAAFGLFTDVSYQTDQNMKNVLGHMAYVLEASKRIFNIPSYKIKIETDDFNAEGEYIYGMITNARSVGGIKGITGDAVDMSDGLFEVTMVSAPQNPVELTEIANALLNPKAESKRVLKMKASRLKVVSETPIPWTLDGEYGGDHYDVEIENSHRTLHLILNPERENNLLTS